MTVFLQGLEKRGPDNLRKRIYFSEDFLRKVWRDKIVFRKLNLPNPGEVPVGPNAVVVDDLGFSRSA